MADELISMDIERTVKELERKLEAEGLPGGGTQPSTSEPDYVSEDLGSGEPSSYIGLKHADIKH